MEELIIRLMKINSEVLQKSITTENAFRYFFFQPTATYRFHMHIAHCTHCLKEVAWICLSDKSERPPPFNAGLDLDNCITGGWRLQPTKKIKIFRPHIWVRFPRTGILAKMCNILKKVEASCDNFFVDFSFVPAL